MSLRELPEHLLGHIQRFLLCHIRGEPTPEGALEEKLDKVLPGEVRVVEALHLSIPERLENASVIATGDVVCESDLYNAHLVALGNVTIAGWCSHAVVVALKDAVLHSAVYSMVLARERLILRTEARFSNLQAARIEAEEAVLFGGQVVARESIRVRQLRGAFGENALMLSIGTPYLQQMEQQYWRQQLRELRERLRLVHQELETLLADRHRRLSEHVQRLQREYGQLHEQLQEIELRSYGVAVQRPIIEVCENVPADTIVSIHGVIYQVPSELLGVRFTSDGMRIVLEPVAEDGPSQSEEAERV